MSFNSLQYAFCKKNACKSENMCYFLCLEPNVKPSGVRVSDFINATSAIVSWDPVVEAPETLRGYLKGYKVCVFAFNVCG